MNASFDLFDQNGHTVTALPMLVDPDAARAALDAWHFERQRRIAPANVRRLAYEMDQGRFIRGTPVFKCVLPNGTEVLANGYHTLHAIAASGKAQVLTIITLAVETMEDVARVYATFDLHRARTWMDSARAMAEENDIPLLKYAAGALAVRMMNFAYTRHDIPELKSRELRFEWVKRYRSEIGLYADAVRETPAHMAKIFRRAGVMAVGLETFRYQPSSAVEFWRGCAEDNGLMVGDPRKTLSRFLLANPVAATAADTNVQARATMLAWNAHFGGRSLHVVKPNQAKSFTLAGTPWIDDRGPDGAVAAASDKPKNPRPTGGAERLAGALAASQAGA